MKFKTLILFFSFTVYTTSCLAWGAEGHRMVAKIAERYLAPGVKEKVVKCLGEDMEKAATWMDEIRSEKEMNYMKPFHYVNIPKGGIYQPTDKPNIVNELNRVREELKQIHSLSPETAAQDVKELIHLMGDISQPLHCGYGEDHGGNKVKVMYMNKKEETLHKVWDTELVKDYEGVMYNLSAQQKKDMENFDVLAWVKIAQGHLPLVYSFNNGVIDAAYKTKVENIVVESLYFSGYRLAMALNKIFAEK